jgi:hypothetical protein
MSCHVSILCGTAEAILASLAAAATERKQGLAAPSVKLQCSILVLHGRRSLGGLANLRTQEGNEIVYGMGRRESVR